MRFYHPEPQSCGTSIYPIFIPFAGCRVRCVFCAQELQTGRSAANGFAFDESILNELKGIKGGAAMELAFYGGTFTALPEAQQEKLLGLAVELKRIGRISGVRCSTRPDALSLSRLRALKAQGLDMVELGVQSFCSEPLRVSGRNYFGRTALEACLMVREAGLRLGVQLMPGMPGMTEEHFRQDIETCASIGPETTRLYPCLVLAETRLAEIWRAGKFVPWSLEMVLELLPAALLKLWARGIRVIRLGLAPQSELQSNILAGPRHPALGQMLRSRALHILIVEKLAALRQGEQGFGLRAPKRFQGEFFGHRGELKTMYASMGILPRHVEWWAEDHFELFQLRQKNK